MRSVNHVIVETAIIAIWLILKTIELYLWIPTRLYRLYLSLSVVGNTDETTTLTATTKRIPTVVIVGGNFAGLAALWKLLDQQVLSMKFKIILIDQRDYSEYTPGILRLFVEPKLLDTLAQPLPNKKSGHDFQFVQGKVLSILEEAKNSGGQFKKVLTYERVNVPNTSNIERLDYDYLILATGMTYRQHPITPSTTNETSLEGRLHSWMNSFQQLQQAKKIIVLGGGAVGVELVAEIVDASASMGEKQITLIDVAPELVMNFPKPARIYAQRWLEHQKGVELKLNQKLKSWTDSSCTLDDGTILDADVVYVCFGSRPNSDLVASSSTASTMTTRRTVKSLLSDSVCGRLYTTDTLQIAYDTNEGKNDNSQEKHVSSSTSVVHDGCIFACGDVATPPSSDEKQAFQAESQGKVAAENVIRLLKSASKTTTKTKLYRYPQDIASDGFMPLVFVLSLGRHDGVLGFNTLCIPGPIAAIAKWVLEYTKVLEMRGNILGRIIWIVAENVVFFLSQTILRPASTTTASLTKTKVGQTKKIS